MNQFITHLEDIHYKYERLTSLIGILQQFTAEVVEIAGAPADSLTNALYEIELGMYENNDRLKAIFDQKRGVPECQTKEKYLNSWYTWRCRKGLR